MNPDNILELNERQMKLITFNKSVLTGEELSFSAKELAILKEIQDVIINLININIRLLQQKTKLLFLMKMRLDYSE